MQAIVIDSPGDFSLREVETPQPAPGWALIKTRAAAFCATDLEVLSGGIPAAYPLIAGHEWCGTVTAVNGPEQAWLGKRVVGSNDVCCLTCRACRSGQWRNCPDFREIGFKLNGAYAQYLTAPLYALREVQENLSDIQAALVEPLGVGLGTLDAVGGRLGETLVILGAGSIGLNVLAAAKAAGMRRITVVERSGGRLPVAAAMGAWRTLASGSCDIEAELKRLYPEGPDVVVDATGDPGCISLALSLARRSGRVGLSGYGRGRVMPIRVDDIHIKDLAVLGAGNLWNMVDRCLDLLQDGIVSTEHLCTRTLALPDFETAVNLARERPAGFVKSVFLFE